MVNYCLISLALTLSDVAGLDARYTKEHADANASIESLRADVSAGRTRL
ncbi:lysis protein, partial [Escherichia coli]|nr:lysis protein [Escherichia coli]